ELLGKAEDRNAAATWVMLRSPRYVKLRYAITSVSIGSDDKNAADLKEGCEIVNDTLPPPAWLRAARAVGVLETIATPEARQLLQSLAKGELNALPTKEAKAALERLNQLNLP